MKVWIELERIRTEYWSTFLEVPDDTTEEEVEHLADKLRDQCDGEPFELQDTQLNSNYGFLDDDKPVQMTGHFTGKSHNRGRHMIRELTVTPKEIPS